MLDSPRAKLTFEAIGTSWHIDIADDISDSRQKEVLEKILKRIEIFDKDYSRFREDSLVTAMSKKTGTFQLPEDAKPMFDIYERMYKLTGGSLTPLIGKVMEDAGYDASYTLKPKEKISQPPAWNEALDYDFPNIVIKQPVMIDLGAAGKGYLIDIVADILKKEGIKEFIIDAGGDIVRQTVLDEKIKIGLENPSVTNEVIGVVDFKQGALCGSAGNRRVWANFHHIIDPYTLQSPRHILATWVIADTALVADAIATALFFSSAKIFQAEYNFEYLILNADNSVEQSKAFPAQLFLK